MTRGVGIGAAALAAVVAALAARTIAAAPSPYPLGVSADGRTLVDAAGAPYLLVGDSPQALIVNLTDGEVEAYFTYVEALGFNAAWINLLCARYTGGRDDGSVIGGLVPFTAKLPGGGAYDLTRPNEEYFQHVDHVVEVANEHGMLVVLDPLETGSWLTVALANGVERSEAYGRFLGARYRDDANILWMSGNDFQDWRSPANRAVTQAVARGIRAEAPRHLQTVELGYFVSSSLDDPTWAPLIDVNATYTYYPTYAQLLKDYRRPNPLPNVMIEANYEFEHDWTGNLTLRRQEYWSMLSGAAGQLYGNAYTWPMVPGWSEHVDTPGARQLATMAALFRPRPWPALVPDDAHRVVTAGYGTFTDRGSVNDSDYAAAARTADGDLVIAYMPTSRSITVDMAQLHAPAAGHWYDPANGRYVDVAGSPFANAGARAFDPPGPNADGDGDWVLVLETDPPALPTPTAIPFATPAPTVPPATSAPTTYATAPPTPTVPATAPAIATIEHGRRLWLPAAIVR